MAFTAYHDVITDQNDAIVQMITNLVTSGWTVPDSGDGRSNFAVPASGIYGAGTNVITVGTMAGGYNAGDIGNFYAWIRLRPPSLVTNAPELLIQHTSSNSGAHVYTMSLILNPGVSAPWAGATSDDPGTPPDVWGPIVGNNQSPSLPANGSTLFYHSSGTRTLDMMVGDIDEGYAFYALMRTNALFFLSGIVYDYCQEADPEDTSPYVVFSNGASTTPWGTTPYMRDGRVYWNAPNPMSPYGAFMKKDVDPGTSGIVYKLPSWSLPVPAPTANAGLLDMVNPYDGVTFDLLEGCVWARTAAGTGNYGYLNGRVKGRSTLIKCFGPETGGTDGNLSTDRTLVCQGDGRHWLVWDGTTALGTDVPVNRVPFVTVSEPMEWTELTEDFAAERVYFDAIEGTSLDGVTAPTVMYTQRVWDTVNLTWCYFESETIDPTPQPTDTTPNHSGSITSHNIVSVTEG